LRERREVCSGTLAAGGQETDLKGDRITKEEELKVTFLPEKKRGDEDMAN